MFEVGYMDCVQQMDGILGVARLVVHLPGRGFQTQGRRPKAFEKVDRESKVAAGTFFAQKGQV